MFRLPVTVTRFALQLIAVENITKPVCSCYWHKIGRPEYCECILPMPTSDDWDERGDFLDDYPDSDPLEDWEDPCNCYNCRRGEPELCLEDDDNGWNLVDCEVFCDGSVAFDDMPEPPVRVSKFYRVNRIKELDHYGIVVASFGSIDRLERSRKHEARKKHFMVPRRKRARIGQILAREEMIERELQWESDANYWADYFPEDHARITLSARAELLERNFPALSASSVSYIAASHVVQGSSSFVGLEELQKWEMERMWNIEEDQDELERFGPIDYPDELSTASHLINAYNHAFLYAFCN